MPVSEKWWSRRLHYVVVAKGHNNVTKWCGICYWTDACCSEEQDMLSIRILLYEKSTLGTVSTVLGERRTLWQP